MLNTLDLRALRDELSSKGVLPPHFIRVDNLRGVPNLPGKVWAEDYGIHAPPPPDGYVHAAAFESFMFVMPKPNSKEVYEEGGIYKFTLVPIDAIPRYTIGKVLRIYSHELLVEGKEADGRRSELIIGRAAIRTADRIGKRDISNYG